MAEEESLQGVRRSPWFNSLISRVLLLCILLFLCLLSSVYVITNYYFGQMAREMEAQAADIAEEISIQLRDAPGAMKDTELEHVRQETQDAFEGVDLHLETLGALPGETQVMLETRAGGGVTKVARYPFMAGDKPMLLTMRVELTPQTEIIRAFSNRYMLFLTAVFVIALGLLLYLIAKILRPLRDLSRSLSAVGEGNLREVQTANSYGEIMALEETFNRMVASLRDKEQIEMNLRQAQRLSALGNLSAGIAHDIRNPLNAIKLLASHDEAAASPERTQRRMSTIRKEVDRLEEIVSGFLSLAKETELNPAPTRVDDLLSECMRLVSKDAEGRDVNLLADLRAGDTVLALDAKQWTRAIINVLLNALDACKPGGRVRLFSRRSDEVCEIEVRDDGGGIPEDVLEHVFEPYYTTKATGTGLGLSITRGIIEEHGGRIHVTSTEGAGTQVLITMPIGDS